MRKAINIVIISLIILFQPWLWRGEGGILEVARLKKTLAQQQFELDKLKQRNSQLHTQITYIKTNPEAIEEQARFKLGMVRKEETYYQVVMPVE